MSRPKKYFLLIILLSAIRICPAQNLVPNGSFEQYTSCPVWTQLYLLTDWMNPSTAGSPDILHQCSGYVPDNPFGHQFAHSGTGYAGLCPFYLTTFNYREYIEVQLTSTLESNVCYHFEMFVNLGNCSMYTTDSIQVYFSNTLVTGVSNSLPLPFTPQLSNAPGNAPDTLNWITVSGNYYAQGGESFLIIGNFRDDANTSYAFVNSTGIYEAAYIFIDDVSLTSCEKPTGIHHSAPSDAATVYSDPVTEEMKVTMNSNETSEFAVYDMSSRKVFEIQFTGTTTLGIASLRKGIYVYEIKTNGRVIQKGKIVRL